MTYDFKRLSGADFEELVHDLLQVDWKLELEIFAGGRDGGVDLRRVDDAGLLIIQCKNYEGSGYSALRTKMRDEELPKIRRLVPNRYVLVTSVSLTVGQKDELFKLLSPWVRNTGDIIGKQDLTARLEANEAVVRRHHKLWLTSVAVMQQILLGAELVQTASEISRIQRKLDVYVETDALSRAVSILEQNRVLIISGEPGIGKSTLADMILLDHIANGFQPAVIRSSLSEGRRMAASGAPTIFYFDDFLGQTYLGDRPDFLGKREDADLVDFIDWVRTSDQHRFILTTREHVLTEALMRSERLRHAGLADERCLITIEDLSRAQRARILYNHLEFSSLPEPYKIEMLRNDFFLEVVDSQRFSPRVIQWLSSFDRLKSVPADAYQDHVRALMKNPFEIWRHAFDHELSQAARDVLIALYSFTYHAYTDDLERCFDALHATSIRRLNQCTVAGAFRSAMKELDGSFIQISEDGAASFINPSIADFLATVLRDDGQLVLDVIGAAVRFNQVSMMIEGAEPGGPFVGVMDRIRRSGQAVATTFDRLLCAPHLRWFKRNGGSRGYFIDLSIPSRASRLIEIRELIPEVAPVAKRAIVNVAEEINANRLQLSETQGLLKAAWENRLNGAWSDIKEVVRAVNEGLKHAYAEDWLSVLDLKLILGSEFDTQFPAATSLFRSYVEDKVIDERLDCDSTTVAEDLRYHLEKLQERHGVNFGYELDQLAEKMAELEEKEERETSGDFFGASRERAPDLTDDEIRSMFGGLLG